jgi:hypothetical protein
MMDVRTVLATSWMIPCADVGPPDDARGLLLPSDDPSSSAPPWSSSSPPVTSSSSSRSIPSMSYCLRSFGLSKTFWARFKSRKVAASPPGRSGWCFRESFRYCFLTSSASMGGTECSSGESPDDPASASWGTAKGEGLGTFRYA